jgi:pilus assembly protein FimV
MKLTVRSEGAIFVNNPEEILKNNPGSVVFARYAEELVREGKIDEAREIAENGIKANPTYAPGHSVLAEILFQQNSEEKAIEELKTAIQLDPQMPEDLLKLGKNYLSQNQLDDAKPYIWAAHKFEPLVSDVQNIYKEAKLSEDTGLAEQSEETLLEVADEPDTDVSETVVMPVGEAEEPVSVEDVEAETPEPVAKEEAEDVVSDDEQEPLETLVGEINEQSVAHTEEAMEESELSDTEEPGFEEKTDSAELLGEEAEVQAIEEISSVESESAEKITEEGPEEEYGIDEDEGFDTLIGNAVESDQALMEEMESLESTGKEETSEEADGLTEIDEEETAAQSFEEEITEDVTTIGDVERKQPAEEYGIDEDEEFDALLDETEESDEVLKEEAESLESAEKEEILEENLPGSVEASEEEPTSESFGEDIIEDVTTVGDVESKQHEEEFGIDEDEGFDALIDEAEESDQVLKEEAESLESTEKEEILEENLPGSVEASEEEPTSESFGEEITEDVTTIGDVESKQPEEEYGIDEDEGFDALIDEAVESDEALREEVESLESTGKEETPEEEAPSQSFEEEITEDVTTVGDVESKQPEEEYGIEEDEGFDTLIDEAVESDQVLKEEAESLESAEKEEILEENLPGSVEASEEEPTSESFGEEIIEDVTTVGDVESKQTEEEYGIEEDEELDALLDETVESDQVLKEEVESLESVGKEETSEKMDGPAIIDDEETASESFGEEISEDVFDYTEMSVDVKPDEPMVGSGSGDQPETIDIMEIDDVEEYDPSKFERDTLAAKGDGPVLSEEERAELLAYEKMMAQSESETLEEIVPGTESETDEKLEEIIEVEPETEEDNESNIDVETGEFFSELTREEADVLSVSGVEEMEDDRELELETKEGIDYSDVLSEKTPAPEMEEAIEEKDEILTDTEAEVEDFSVTESGMEFIDEPEEISETEILSPDSSGENLRIVEEMIKSAPDIEVPAMDEEMEDAEDLPLDELISDYENSMKEEPSVSPDKEYPQPEKNEYENMPDSYSSTVAGEETTYSFPDESTLPEENITATMAEIYVSQKMIPRAITIYKALLEKDPDNEKVKSRLKEITELHDQQSDES